MVICIQFDMFNNTKCHIATVNSICMLNSNIFSAYTLMQNILNIVIPSTPYYYTYFHNNDVNIFVHDVHMCVMICIILYNYALNTSTVLK